VTTEAVAPEPRPRSSSWVFQVTTLSLVLGCFLGVALQAQRALRAAGLPGNRYAVLVPYYLALKDSNQNLQQQVDVLRQKTIAYQSQMAAGSDMTRAMKQEMENLQMLAGLTPVHGPGLVITLRDTKQTIPPEFPPESGMVHDQDLAMVLNELKAAGAEALAIAGVDGRAQRIILNTAPRCAGPIVRVNDAPLSQPFTIWAIGDPSSLESALRMTGGLVEKLFPPILGMIEIKRQADIKLPRFSSSIHYTYAKPLGSTKPIGAQ
jgi:uncharacterized protein YlxW (UPF0749 family)